MRKPSHTYRIIGFSNNGDECCWRTVEFNKRFVSSKLTIRELAVLGAAIVEAEHFVGVDNINIERTMP